MAPGQQAFHNDTAHLPKPFWLDSWQDLAPSLFHERTPSGSTKLVEHPDNCQANKWTCREILWQFTKLRLHDHRYTWRYIRGDSGEGAHTCSYLSRSVEANTALLMSMETMHLHLGLPYYHQLQTPQMFVHDFAGDRQAAASELGAQLRDRVEFERTTIWKDMVGMERKRGESIFSEHQYVASLLEKSILISSRTGSLSSGPKC